MNQNTNNIRQLRGAIELLTFKIQRARLARGTRRVLKVIEDAADDLKHLMWLAEQIELVNDGPGGSKGSF